MCLRWSPTGRSFDLRGKIIESSDSECKSDSSNGDNACTSNPQEPTIKRFPNSTSFLFLGTVHFGNDHVVAIMGYGDLQWGNILITRVAFRRNTYFVRNLEGVDLLKGNRTTNLYTINLHEMASASPICLMDPATSTKKKQKSITPTQTSSKFKAEITLALHGSMWSNESRKNKWEAVCSAPVIIVRTDNGTEFKNQVLQEYFNSVCISHQASSIRTPQQNRVVERRNRMLVEAARTMLIFSRAPLFLWAEVIATVCYTQNRSIIHPRFEKNELINSRKPDISFLYVFGALCYPKNDHEDIGKLGAKCDISFFIGDSANSCAYRVYNRRTNKIMEIMNVTFDEVLAMDFEQRSSKHGLQSMTSRQISSGLDLTYTPSTITTQQPTERELDLLFEAMYDDYIGSQQSSATRTALAAQAPQVLQTPMASTTTADTAPTPTNSSSQATNIPNTSHDVDQLEPQQQHVQQQDNQAALQPKIVADNVSNAMLDGNTFVNPFVPPSTSAAESSSSQYVDPSNMHTFYQPYPHTL
ncbi:integrase, catalytic region, zinc finger, CCHC-type containing protein [Tanacetum coccineum]